MSIESHEPLDGPRVGASSRHAVVALLLAFGFAGACGDDVENGTDSPADRTGGASGTSTGDGTVAETTGSGSGTTIGGGSAAETTGSHSGTSTGDGGGDDFCTQTDECDLCLNSMCQQSFTDCEADGACEPILRCIEQEVDAGGCDLAACYAMRSSTFVNLRFCVAANCGDIC